jgi:quinol monooxygenase YgiN
MSRIGIMVEFRIKPGRWTDFDAHIRAHAARTLADEPGCERFDVFQPLKDDGTADESRIMLCEVYADRAAFDAHRASPRMPSVGAKSAEMLDGRALTICALS